MGRQVVIHKKTFWTNGNGKCPMFQLLKKHWSMSTNETTDTRRQIQQSFHRTDWTICSGFINYAKTEYRQSSCCMRLVWWMFTRKLRRTSAFTMSYSRQNEHGMNAWKMGMNKCYCHRLWDYWNSEWTVVNAICVFDFVGIALCYVAHFPNYMLA